MSVKLEPTNSESKTHPENLPVKKERVLSPVVNVYENEKEAIFLIDLPGVREDGLDITIEKGLLQVDGKVSIPVKSEYKKEYNEVQVDVYRRRFNLGKLVDPESAIAKFVNGQLRLTLPKVEPVKKKIQISSGV